MPRLAIVCSHPVQYYAPWFRHLAARSGWQLEVFYLWDFGSTLRHDPGFGHPVRWDEDLLGGYPHRFVANQARRPGTHRFFGLRNRQLIPSLRGFQPDVVLLFGYGWHSHVSLALGWRDCPLILRGDSHDLGRGPETRWRRGLRHRLLSTLFRRFAGFAAVGSANARLYAIHGVPREKVVHVPHCVDNDALRAAAQAARPHRAAWRAAHGLPPDHQVIAFVGKFTPKKRPDLLLQAFQQNPLAHTSLLLVGDGPLAPPLKAQAAHSPHVHFLPFQNRRAIPEVLAAIDLLVLPSQGHGETWGLIVNEAMAAGVPAVVSSHVGCREDLIDHGRTGWSFPAGDGAALATVLAEASSAARTGSARIHAAITERIDRYTFDAATAGLVNLLEKVAPLTPAPAP